MRQHKPPRMILQAAFPIKRPPPLQRAGELIPERLLLPEPAAKGGETGEHGAKHGDCRATVGNGARGAG